MALFPSQRWAALPPPSPGKEGACWSMIAQDCCSAGRLVFVFHRFLCGQFVAMKGNQLPFFRAFWRRTGVAGNLVETSRSTASAPGSSHKRAGSRIALAVVAKRKERTPQAPGLSGRTYLPAVPDELVGEVDPVLFRNDRHKVKLDLDRILFFGESDALREPFDVGVHDDSRNPKGTSQNYVGGLSSNTGQRHQVLHVGGDLSPVLFHQSPAARLDVFGLIAKEPRWPNQCLQLRKRYPCIVPGCSKLFKKCLGDLVDPNVRALGGKDGGNQHFQRGFVLKGRLDIRVGLP